MHIGISLVLFLSLITTDFCGIKSKVSNLAEMLGNTRPCIHLPFSALWSNKSTLRALSSSKWRLFLLIVSVYYWITSRCVSDWYLPSEETAQNGGYWLLLQKNYAVRNYGFPIQIKAYATNQLDEWRGNQWPSQHPLRCPGGSICRKNLQKSSHQSVETSTHPAWHAISIHQTAGSSLSQDKAAGSSAEQSLGDFPVWLYSFIDCYLNDH